MNDIFQFHEQLTSRYNDFSQGFNIIREEDIKGVVHKFLNEQKKFCPEPLIMAKAFLLGLQVLHDRGEISILPEENAKEN